MLVNCMQTVYEAFDDSQFPREIFSPQLNTLIQLFSCQNTHTQNSDAALSAASATTHRVGIRAEGGEPADSATTEAGNKMFVCGENPMGSRLLETLPQRHAESLQRRTEAFTVQHCHTVCAVPEAVCSSQYNCMQTLLKAMQGGESLALMTQAGTTACCTRWL